MLQVSDQTCCFSIFVNLMPVNSLLCNFSTHVEFLLVLVGFSQECYARLAPWYLTGPTGKYNLDSVLFSHFITLHHRLSCYIWEDGQIKPGITQLFVQAKTQWQCKTLTDMMLRQRPVTANTQKSAKLWTWENFCFRTYNLFCLMYTGIMYLNTNVNPDLYTARATWPYSQMQMQIKVFQVYINAMQHWCAQSLSGLEKHRHKEKPNCTGHQCDP